MHIRYLCDFSTHTHTIQTCNTYHVLHVYFFWLRNNKHTSLQTTNEGTRNIYWSNSLWWCTPSLFEWVSWNAHISGHSMTQTSSICRKPLRSYSCKQWVLKIHVHAYSITIVFWVYILRLILKIRSPISIRLQSNNEQLTLPPCITRTKTINDSLLYPRRAKTFKYRVHLLKVTGRNLLGENLPAQARGAARLPSVCQTCWCQFRWRHKRLSQPRKQDSKNYYEGLTVETSALSSLRTSHEGTPSTHHPTNPRKSLPNRPVSERLVFCEHNSIRRNYDVSASFTEHVTCHTPNGGLESPPTAPCSSPKCFMPVPKVVLRRKLWLGLIFLLSLIILYVNWPSVSVRFVTG